jgi:DNA-binding HxlR family transcriptional regulator
MKTPHDHGETCPVAAVAELVGDMWTLLIVRDLATRSRRFGDLVESLKGISTRTLTAKLQHLEKNNIISRYLYQERPPRATYELTKKGKDLIALIETMRSFGERHLS